MAERRRGPGRPAYDSKQKLVAAACALLAERGFEATSPQMFQQRSGVGHGSMYHHFPGKGKEGLALDAIGHMRASTTAFLDGSPTPEGPEVEEVRASIVTALDRLFARKEGQALVRLLADAVAGALPSLATATQDWCDDSRALIAVRLRATGHSQEAIAEALLQCAPTIRQSGPKRETRNWHRYAERTAAYAFGVAGDLALARNEKYSECWRKVESMGAEKRQEEAPRLRMR